MRGKTKLTHTLNLPFKDNLIRSQVRTNALEFDCTSVQIFSSPKHTPRMWMRLSMQPKGPERATSLQASNLNPEDFWWLILAHVTFSYRPRVFCTTSISLQYDTKMETSLAYAKTLARFPLETVIPRRAGLLAPSLRRRRRSPVAKA